MSQKTQAISASAAGTVQLGDITVNRMGYGAMRITGKGVWGPPADRKAALATLRQSRLPARLRCTERGPRSRACRPAAATVKQSKG